jgi:two-component system, NtrC family, nitrogen regulation sensor histidine kinase NtrY
MSLRQKLLLLFSLTVAASVAAVAWTVLVRIRHVFEQRDQQETALVVSQFEREFQHRSNNVAAAIDRLASGERARRIASEIAQSGDTAPYFNEAQIMARDSELDFLELVDRDGAVISSAQWPARFGYPEPAASAPVQGTFLKTEELPDNSSSLGLFAMRAVEGSEGAVRLIGGKRLDQTFLADLPVAPGMTVGLYTDATAATAPAFESTRLAGASGDVPGAARYQPLIDSARKSGQEASSILFITPRREDSVNATAIPLKNEMGNVQAVLTVAISRNGLVEAQGHIRSIAYVVAGGGILLAVVFSLWITARVSRPIEELAHAAQEIASGNWGVEVPERGYDEVTALACSFNHMSEQLRSQRERLVQSERVAAWRELARRLAHELKNPLFPLQLTVENLVRARSLPAEEFDEVFREGTATLTTEIANLKTIIGRFSDFSKMPKPELERIDGREVVRRVVSLFESGASQESEKLNFKVDLSQQPMPLLADPELIHRAFSNLVLNAMDAMPNGGDLTLSAAPRDGKVEFRVADTGAGLTPEECERLFTPYYTTKQHGTGLGLAIVQSVIADHGGSIAVESRAGAGATFIITLPRVEA